MNNYSAEQTDRLRLIRSENVGPATYWNLLKRFGSAQAALDAMPSLARNGGLRRSIKICSKEKIEQELNQLHRYGAELLFAGNPNYPNLLGTISGAPPVVTIAGHKHLLEKPAIAIVGARRASAAGRKLARDFSQSLGKHGYVVVSGLALGIDGAAHEGSLEAGTIAVIAGGIDQIYPPDHEDLYHQIKSQGLILTEMPFGTVAQARHFPRRNRLVSGLSRAVVVIEANQKSGSLITANFALEQNRDVYAVPGSPLDPRSKGTNALIKQGAILLESVDDILSNEELSISTAIEETHEELTFVQEGSWMVSETDIEAARSEVLSLLSPSPIPIDVLVTETGLSPALIQSILVEIELAGRLERHLGNSVSLSTPEEIE